MLAGGEAAYADKRKVKPISCVEYIGDGRLLLYLGAQQLGMAHKGRVYYV